MYRFFDACHDLSRRELSFDDVAVDTEFFQAFWRLFHAEVGQDYNRYIFAPFFGADLSQRLVASHFNTD